MSVHLDVKTLVAFTNGEGSPGVEAHLRSCSQCRDLAAVVGLELEPPSKKVGPDPTGSYRDLRLWGQGGMGEVYLATDSRLQRQVIIKKPPLASDSVRYLKLAARLEHERAVLASLNHPAIPPVYEGGQLDDGEPFFSMPIAGIETLTTAIRRLNTLSERIALLPSMITVAEGVAYAHGRGVIHRDIKPDHVLLGSAGEARLIDWGLAKVERRPNSGDEAIPEPETSPTQVQRSNVLATVQGLYTEGYSCPEQKAEEPAQRHFDVYSLGATLYYIVTGLHPSGPGPARRHFPSRCPEDLRRIIQKAMHTDPTRRYRDASELTLVLKSFQAGRLVHPNLVERTVDWVRRHSMSFLVVTICSGAGCGGYLLAQHRAELAETQRQHFGRLAAVQADVQAQARASDRLGQKSADLETRLQTLRAATTAERDRLKRKLAGARRYRAELEQTLSNSEEARIQALEQWRQTQQELEAAAAAVTAAEGARSSWEARAERTNRELSASRSQLQSTQLELRKLNDEIARLRQESEQRGGRPPRTSSGPPPAGLRLWDLGPTPTPVTIEVMTGELEARKRKDEPPVDSP